MKIIDASHPFFRPLWRRIVITAVCGGWALFELSRGAHLWAAIFGAMAALCVWEFFAVWTDDDEKGGPEGPP